MKDKITPMPISMHRDEPTISFIGLTDTNKAQSKSEGKPSYLDIFEWLDIDFLMEMVKQMKIPVEVLKKYPKDNWKQGSGDEAFTKARRESALRHLIREKDGDLVDIETGAAHEAALACNAMMIFNSKKKV